jgi:hypothetical protein
MPSFVRLDGNSILSHRSYVTPVMFGHLLIVAAVKDIGADALNRSLHTIYGFFHRVSARCRDDSGVFVQQPAFVCKGDYGQRQYRGGNTGTRFNDYLPISWSANLPLIAVSRRGSEIRGPNANDWSRIPTAPNR